MYQIRIANTLMPLAPEKISYKIKNRNETKVLIDGSEITVPKRPGLTEISFKLRLPGKRLPFAIYEYDRFKNPLRYLDLFQQLKTKGQPFLLDIARINDLGTPLYNSAAITSSSSIVKVQTNGQAPPGLAVGTLVVTAGGIWKISAVNNDGSYQSNKVAECVNVQANGKAPSGLSAGTYVITAGGLYRITAVKSDGSYESVKVSDDMVSVLNESTSDSSKVTLEDYTIDDSAEDGDDIMVNLTFRLWQEYATQYVDIQNGKKVVKSVGSIATTTNIPDSYVIQPGDTLTAIAKKFFGNSAYWTEIYALNKDTIEAKAIQQGRTGGSMNGKYLYYGVVLKLKAIPEEDKGYEDEQPVADE